ncbi:signal peptidase I [Massilia sp. H6]|uniref:signal peptidase I n=1 Tax=Massilia sp. H6 TaxID=2970464 RepID=UPI00216A3431|nr:signal peptidase I [Massilia sp. H6]UVW27265.1 signal peptidase I [Massilia sp. H6]
MTGFIRANKGFLLFMLLFGVFRTAVADWNPIPSSSMRPSLLEGDVVLVNRLAYQVKLPLTDVVVARTGEPRRGDVVTFSSPHDGTRLIKRVLALPGERVEMRNERLLINGVESTYSLEAVVREPADGMTMDALRMVEAIDGRSHRIQLLPQRAVARDFGPVTVPPDGFLVLGDNRDNSADSRIIGFVPRHLLIGRAEGILVSADYQGDWMPRFERFGISLR